MLVKWKPFDDLFKLHREMDRFFDTDIYPAVDIYEDEERISIEAELPGMKVEDVDISIDKNILTIKGEINQEDRREKKSFWRVERSYGSFSRSFTLPSTIDQENIVAEHKDGILTIQIAKKQGVEPKKIEIKKIT